MKIVFKPHDILTNSEIIRIDRNNEEKLLQIDLYNVR